MPRPRSRLDLGIFLNILFYNKNASHTPAIFSILTGTILTPSIVGRELDHYVRENNDSSSQMNQVTRLRYLYNNFMLFIYYNQIYHKIIYHNIRFKFTCKNILVNTHFERGWRKITLASRQATVYERGCNRKELLVLVVNLFRNSVFHLSWLVHVVSHHWLQPNGYFFVGITIKSLNILT